MHDLTIPHIPDAELLVMQVIWNTPVSLSAKQIIQKIQKESRPDWKATTIRTLIDRLAAKGYLTVDQRGRERYYTAAMEKRTYLEEVTRKFLSLHYNGSFYQMFTLLKGDQLGQLTAEEMARFKHILSKLDVK